MPFTPTPDLPEAPAVRIFFSGLMLLHPDSSKKTCEVFVNRSAPNHQLTIEVREKQDGKPDLIRMRHVGPLPFAEKPPGTPLGTLPIHGMIIQVDKAPKGIRSYDGTTASKEGQPLNLAINLQDARYHNGKAGKPDLLGGRPSIWLNDAVFYTADVTDPQLTINLKKKIKTPADPIIETLAPFASLIGANVYLDDGDQLLVRWRPEGITEELKLTKPTQGVSYEIYIVNDPLYESNTLGIPAHDEFNEYYKILPEVPTTDQLRLEVIEPQQGPVPTAGRGSTKTPCMSCILDP